MIGVVGLDLDYFGFWMYGVFDYYPLHARGTEKTFSLGGSKLYGVA